jgi:hypothetical protein
MQDDDRSQARKKKKKRRVGRGERKGLRFKMAAINARLKAQGGVGTERSRMREKETARKLRRSSSRAITD